jgi:hypothetical protein
MAGEGRILKWLPESDRKVGIMLAEFSRSYKIQMKYTAPPPEMGNSTYSRYAVALIIFPLGICRHIRSVYSIVRF